MPNHVHLLIKTYEGFDIGKLVWSWKRHVSKYVFEDKDYNKLFMGSLKNVEITVLDKRTLENKQSYLQPASECGAPGEGKKRSF